MSLVRKGHYPRYSDFAWPVSAQWDNLWTTAWSPALNIAEDENRYEIELAAPGFHKEDFVISVDHNILHLAAVHNDEHEQDLKTLRRREYIYSAFRRSIGFPEDIREDGVQAHYMNGILHVVVKKTTPLLMAPKQISTG